MNRLPAIPGSADCHEIARRAPTFDERRRKHADSFGAERMDRLESLLLRLQELIGRGREFIRTHAVDIETGLAAIEVGLKHLKFSPEKRIAIERILKFIRALLIRETARSSVRDRALSLRPDGNGGVYRRK